MTSLLTAPELADPDELIGAGAVATATVLSEVGAVADALLAAAVCFSRLTRSAALVVLPPRLDTDILLLQSENTIRDAIANCC
jgi:hypothetical protein